jgi:hypothetical protein
MNSSLSRLSEVAARPVVVDSCPPTQLRDEVEIARAKNKRNRSAYTGELSA